MKVYIATGLQDDVDRNRVKEFSRAIKKAHFKDYFFVRDREDYQTVSKHPKKLWNAVYDEIAASDALLVDARHADEARFIEIGVAFSLKKPVIVVVKKGESYSHTLDGVSSTIIHYDAISDITEKLKEYDKDRNFNITDRLTLLLMFILLGASSAWLLGNIFLPLGAIWLVIYWIGLRMFVPVVKEFDRLVILLPIAAIWLGGIYLLIDIYQPAAIAWAVLYWVAAIFILQRLKLSL